MNKELKKMINKLKDDTLLRRKMKTRDEKLEKVEAELRRARVLIRDAGTNHSSSSSQFDDPDYVPTGSIYRNPKMFHRYVVFISIISGWFYGCRWVVGPSHILRTKTLFFTPKAHLYLTKIDKAHKEVIRELIS